MTCGMAGQGVGRSRAHPPTAREGWPFRKEPHAPAPRRLAPGRQPPCWPSCATLRPCSGSPPSQRRPRRRAARRRPRPRSTPARHAARTWRRGPRRATPPSLRGKGGRALRACSCLASAIKRAARCGGRWAWRTHAIESCELVADQEMRAAARVLGQGRVREAMQRTGTCRRARRSRTHSSPPQHRPPWPAPMAAAAALAAAGRHSRRYPASWRARRADARPLQRGRLAPRAARCAEARRQAQLARQGRGARRCFLQ
jgi:hypothetical protein